MDQEVMQAPLLFSRRNNNGHAEGRALEGSGFPDTGENPDHLSELNVSRHDSAGNEPSSDERHRSNDVSGIAPVQDFLDGSRGGEALEESRGHDSAAADASAMWCIPSWREPFVCCG